MENLLKKHRAETLNRREKVTRRHVKRTWDKMPKMSMILFATKV